jgi:hypothetical protein
MRRKQYISSNIGDACVGTGQCCHIHFAVVGWAFPQAQISLKQQHDMVNAWFDSHRCVPVGGMRVCCVCCRLLFRHFFSLLSRAALQLWAAGQAANCCASCIALIALVFGMMFGLCVVCALMSHDNASSPQTLLCIACVLVRCVRSSQEAVRATIDDGHTALPERELCDGRV